ALMPTLGLSGARYAAAALEALVAIGARFLLTGVPGAGAEPPPADERSVVFEPVVAAVFLMGASALALEVILTRVLVSVTGASIYAFSIVLTVFLLGIGLGSHWLEPDDEDEVEDHAGRFVEAAIFVPGVTFLGLFLLQWRLGEDSLFHGLSNRMPAGTDVVTLWLNHALWAGLALLAPAFLFGRALPSGIAVAVARRSPASRERVLGTVYGANTVGSLVGALLAGFVLVPLIGLRGAMFVALLLPIAAAFLAGGTRVCGTIPAALIFAGPFAGMTLSFFGAPSTPITLAHGTHASVSVEESEMSGERVRALRVNGKVVATSGAVDLRLQRLLAAVPMQLHGDVRSAVVIGMGTGMTAGTLLGSPELERLDVIEISAVMPEAGARPFAEWNGDLLDDARTTVIHGDGRHELARAPERYDLVTSDPIHPWTAGSSDLYCVEHFEVMAAHLADGGIASQWLPLYQLSDEDVRTVIASWTAAFPETSAWLTAYDLVLVGANAGLAGPAEIIERELPARLAGWLKEAGVGGPSALGALFAGDDAALRAFAANVPPMRDDRPVLEFRAPRSFLAGYSLEALRWAARPGLVETLPAPSQEEARELHRLLDSFLAELPNGWSRAAAAYGTALTQR
ncbi:MAG: fused MFS/spermidine synthase, partial [Planctomycetota bacterium]